MNETHSPEELKSILNTIDVKQFGKNANSYNNWIGISMSFAMAGGNYDDWLEWCKQDAESFSRMKHPERKWNSFLKGNDPDEEFIILEELALHFGTYEPMPEPITCCGKTAKRPVSQLINFLEAVYKPDEYLKIITRAYDHGSGKFSPVQTFVPIKCKDFLKKLDDGIGEDLTLEQIFPYNHKAGVWIGVNPIKLNGPDVDQGKIKASKNTGMGSDKAVSDFRYVLIEFDADQDGNPIPIEKQYRFFLTSKLPIVALTFSGGKSLHALVRIDADDAEDYKYKVEALYNWLIKKGYFIDPANKNPSRLTRLAGFKRYDERQYLIATNIGGDSFTEWMKENMHPELYSEDEKGRIIFHRDWIGDWIIKTESIKRMNGEIYLFNEKDGCYYPDPKLESIGTILRSYDSNISGGKIKEVREYIYSRFPAVLGDTDKSHDDEYIGFKNCAIDLTNFEKHKKTRKMNLTNIIPHNYGIPENGFSTVQGVVDASFFCGQTLKQWANGDPELQTLLLEIIGSCMESRLEPFQKAFIIYGNRNSGKSKFVRLIQKILGSKNCSNLELKDLNAQFRVHTLKDKKANIRNDISKVSIKDSAMLKQAITGDTVIGEIKGLPEMIPFDPFATMVFSCNKVPYIAEEGGSIEKRLSYVPFTNSFIQGGDKDFEKRIYSEEILETFIVLAVDALKDAIQRNSFTLPECTQKLEDETLIENNPVFQFWSEYFRGGVSRTHIKDHLNDYNFNAIDFDLKKIHLEDYFRFCYEQGLERGKPAFLKEQTENYFRVKFDRKKRSLNELEERLGFKPEYTTYKVIPVSVI